ncbi:MAG: cytochrome C oxidase subunit IV family protein [Planctomycetota bacterium]
MTEKVISYKIYWLTWFLLLGITLLSIGADYIKLPLLRVILLLTLMFSKATLIAMNFMHLSSEKFNLIITIIVGIILTSLVLFILISVDAYTISRFS